MNPTTVPQIQDIVRQNHRIVAQGSGSKTGLAPSPEGAVSLDLSGLSGMLEYQPDEYTFTALAGTSLAEVDRALAGHGQYLPFDPPLVECGATLGGTVASGLSGPGRYRYGGLRDFLLGVKFVDAQGQPLRGGGKVVKNAAGFDLPKLMVGSLGQYGVLVELTFKVLPRPEANLTARIHYSSLSEALEALMHLTATPLEIFALDLEPGTDGASLLIRLGGKAVTLPARLDRLRSTLGLRGEKREEIIEGEAEPEVWRVAREFTWVPENTSLVKVPLTPKRVPDLDAGLAAQPALRRYSAGANLAWVAWPEELESLYKLLANLELSGLVVLGPPGRPRLGLWVGETFARRVKQALDPQGKFILIEPAPTVAGR